MKALTILGSTGSIGTQTLAVLRQFPEDFRIVGLSAASNMALLAEQIVTYQPEIVAVGSPEKAEILLSLLANHPLMKTLQLVVGTNGLHQIAAHPASETVVIGISGFAGLQPTLTALNSNKQVLTANKETFVTAGHLVKPFLKQIVPLDSEHSAIFQCLHSCQDKQKEVKTLYLTASGGPFLNFHKAQFNSITVQQALQHPNWQMGPRITIDSATMMNKGLEIIEAHHLFGMPFERIEPVIHPQSIMHSAVAFVDGSIVAQLGQPNMQLPLQYGLTYPQRWPANNTQVHLDLTTLGTLQFFPVDMEKFPCLQLAQWAGEMGGSMPVVLNAADEMAVSAFLKEKIRFTDIPKHIERVLQAHATDWIPEPSLDEIHAVDRWARQQFPAKQDLIPA